MIPQLCCYWIRVRKKHKRVLSDLDVFDGEHDLLVCIVDWLNDLCGKLHVSGSGKQTIHFNTDQTNIIDRRNIVNTIRSGKTGISTEIIKRDLSTHSIKDIDDIEALSMPFLFSIPRESQNCYFLCMDYDNYNPYTVLKQYIMERFKDAYPEYTMKFEPIVFTDIIREFIKEGELISLELKKKGLSHDQAEELYKDPTKYGNPTKTLTITADQRNDKKFNNKIFVKMRRLIDEGKKTFLDFEFDNAYVEFKLNGRRRKIQINGQYSNANKVMIPSYITIDPNGLPNVEQTIEFAFEILKDLQTEEKNV